jgi:hypothetical protein
MLAVTLTEVLVPVVCVAVAVALAFGFLWLRDKVFHPRPTSAEVEAANKRFEERLLNPDLTALEAHFRCAMPHALRDLYANRDEILRGDFELVSAGARQESQPWFVAFYQPADVEHVGEAWPGTEEMFEFANDGCGNGYLIDPRVSDPPVKFHDHETGETERVADSLTAFLAMPRRKPED